jgi:hypothetical protein
LVRVEWDGATLVTAKAPGTHYSVLQAWSLAKGGAEIIVQSISKSVNFGFDFRVAGMSPLYLGPALVYTRVSSASDCLDCTFALQSGGVRWGPSVAQAPFAFRLRDGATRLEVSCQIEQCGITDILWGRQQTPRTVTLGQALTVPLTANTIVQAVSAQGSSRSFQR